MHLRFFGDSWYWCWFPPKEAGDVLKNSVHGGRVPVLEHNLRSHHHYVEHFNIPGSRFSDAVDRLLNMPTDADPVVNIILASSNLRAVEDLADYDTSDYDRFMDQVYAEKLKQLTRLNDHLGTGKFENQHIIIVGCQEKMPAELFDKIVSRHPNLHLMSECIVSEIAQKYINTGGGELEPLDLFSFVTIWTNEVNEDWDERLIDHLVEADRLNHPGYENHYRPVLYPDTSHLGPVGAIYFAQLLLDYFKEIGLS